MGILILAAMGGALGYLACMVLGCQSEDTLLNVVVGMLGSLLTTLLMMPYLGIPRLLGGDIAVVSFISSIMGATVALGILNISRMRPASY